MPSAETYTTYHRTTYPYIDPTQPKFSCAGKNVLVTGGGYGIGKGIARSFAKARASNLILLGRTSSILEETKAELEAEFPSTKVHISPADITDAAAINKIFNFSVSELGHVDIVVNNAAFLPTISALKDADLKNWWRGFEVNVLGTATVTQAFLKTKPAGLKGTVISINTSVAHYGIFPGYSAYVASKMASQRMNESFQAESSDVRFISLQPGGVDTEMYAKFHMPEDYAMTDIQLPSDTCVWLASDEAEFLGGRFVWTNWDAEELIKRKDTIISEKELTSMVKPIEGDLY
ncbi:hypothetical protein BKA67DRAFT_571350 [Truncatella angustata]|uniref:Uncharacterized protein n=1 Tax=Truncatella angustata TaxID=152316 RepID=A0A9P8UG74_9PEZI|nr:uncharacterized protein BKA67DRAFT_571350 [Truncatella angustata]KAH6651610.1 hypothetical protein BKA67DRAFT_571350 [Truncatella angustata]KAH8203516.1 hypothetical protein TruAng_002264 [Truncatella angustata]